MNDKIKTYLDRMVSSRKRPNSYLFLGAGEKWDAAVYFISALAGKSGDKEFLRRLEERVHPDVVVIEPEIVEDKKGRTREKGIAIEKIRKAQERLKFFPYELEKKFCLIKKAEKMNAESSNALLKILEEPTGSTFFVLLANDADSVLPTIFSRCAVLRFAETELFKWNEDNREKFKSFFKEEIFEKLNYIEKISKDKNEIIGIFKDWELVAAEGLRNLSKDKEGYWRNQGRMKKVAELLENIREAINRLEQTNASPRTTGERLVLNF